MSIQESCQRDLVELEHTPDIGAWLACLLVSATGRREA
jgi:hypothetical protein